jgi:hypothetical protein
VRTCVSAVHLHHRCAGKVAAKHDCSGSHATLLLHSMEHYPNYLFGRIYQR